MSSGVAVLLMRRVLKRWRAPFVLLGMVMLLWLAFLMLDRRPTTTAASHVAKHTTTSVRQIRLPESLLSFLHKEPSGGDNVQKPLRESPHLDETVGNYEMGKPPRRSSKLNLEGFDGSNEVVIPLVRRGPVPNIVDLGEAMPDEENVAREVVDINANEIGNSGKKPLSNMDENAAHEEHSGEINLLQVKSLMDFNVSNKSNNRLEEANEIAKREESFHQLPEQQIDENFVKQESVVQPAEQQKDETIAAAQEESFHQLPEQQKDENILTHEEIITVEVVDTINDPPNSKQKLIAELNSNVVPGKLTDDTHVIDVPIGSKEKIKSTHEVAEQEASFHQLPEHQKELPEDKYDAYNNWRNLTVSEISRLSVLGRRLFLNEKTGHEQNKKFKIHVWKYMKYIERRLLRHFGSQVLDPFEGCSVSNCELTTNDEDVLQADAVLFHLHRVSGPPTDVPRRLNQLWVWMSDESPYNVFMVSKNRRLSEYNGFFNWSMSYRVDADVPVPYGRTVPLKKDQYLEKVEDFFSQKPKDITILGSNCGGKNQRYKYISELQRFISVDIYGGCGPLKCEGHFNKDCIKLNDYKFYLAFENSNCEDYITEKVWWNALGKGSVPVVMGATKANYMKLLPPGSFIYAEDFDSPQQLAQYLRYLLDNPDLYSQYHSWRKRYVVLNEHGYFQSPVYHFCRLCEALNYNSRASRATADLEGYFDISGHCHAPKWRPG